jgi:periplasmic copper chaperone A
MTRPHTFVAQLACAVLIGMGTPAQAHEYYTRSFIIVHPWANPTEPGAVNAAVYVKFTEISDDDKLIAAGTQIADKVELRHSRQPDPLEGVSLTQGNTVELTADTAYLVLTDLKIPLLWGRSYPMTLVFEKSGPVLVMVSIGAH